MTEEKEKSRKVYYACGTSISAARKFCLFIFQEYYHSAKVNSDDRMFHIFIHPVVGGVTFEERFTKEYIEWFKQFWGEIPGFKLVTYEGIKSSDL